MENKKYTYVGVAAVIIILVGIMLATNFRGSSNSNEISGAAIVVKYYGVSDELMQTQAGKMQTLIEISSPEVLDLKTREGKLELVNNVIEKVNFPEGIKELYRKHPLAVKPTEQKLEVVQEKALGEIDNFKNHLYCFTKLGEKNWRNLNLVLVSELRIESCDNEDYFSAHMQHTYFNQDGGNRFNCDQDNDKLFLINKETGDIVEDITLC